MASSVKSSVSLLFITLSFWFSVSLSSPTLSSMCHLQFNQFLRDLQLQCPATIAASSPIEMDGESLDRLLSSFKSNAYTAILFYASWCPFSKNLQPKFNALASMYPQIKHVKVEQSSALPSVFSRHGIHSVPSILIANKTARVQYHGPKDLRSLLDFYQLTTGLAHEVNFTEEDELESSSENSPRTLGSWASLKDEPCLSFSLLFVLLKAFLYLCPNFVSNVMTLWVTYIPRLNLAIFGESKQLLAHALNLFDVKSAFRKLKLSKSRKFHNGARSARVLASSLASVSLGETSSARE
ncbi:hypothetical protein L1987_33549 [Smallanthus sonchifolius]|uniref:Uncharacterized protein n=1 Tax=Smallanthus sonchifolius TaxID=185202 RepID=A0ACB9HQN7_9ASTR|nr:hypothetical protein L1987_33549 [Smallanthus sonchifolius]